MSDLAREIHGQAAECGECGHSGCAGHNDWRAIAADLRAGREEPAPWLTREAAAEQADALAIRAEFAQGL